MAEPDMDMLRSMLREYGQQTPPEQSPLDAERAALTAGRTVRPSEMSEFLGTSERVQYGEDGPMPTAFSDGTSSPDEHAAKLAAVYAERERLRPQYQAALAREAAFDAAAPRSGGVAVPGYASDGAPLDFGPPAGFDNINDYLRTRDAQWLPPDESEIEWR